MNMNEIATEKFSLPSSEDEFEGTVRPSVDTGKHCPSKQEVAPPDTVLEIFAMLTAARIRVCHACLRFAPVPERVPLFAGDRLAQCSMHSG